MKLEDSSTLVEIPLINTNKDDDDVIDDEIN